MTKPTGHPFGSLQHLLQTYDLEAYTMDKIGHVELEMFYALIEDSIRGEISQGMEEALNRIRSIEAGQS